MKNIKARKAVDTKNAMELQFNAGPWDTVRITRKMKDGSQQLVTIWWNDSDGVVQVIMPGSTTEIKR